MKIRQSGMPESNYWQSFFDVDCLFDELFAIQKLMGDAVEFGSGYGTFSLPLASRLEGRVLALDIEPELITQLTKQAEQAGLNNLQAMTRDFIKSGTGLEANTQSLALVFNLLHLEQPTVLLNEAYRVLKPNGQISLIHWRKDIPTPRGPSLDIRPSPEDCADALQAVGFSQIRNHDISDCCPYHFGLTAVKAKSSCEPN